MSSSSLCKGKIELLNGQFVLRVSADRLEAVVSCKEPDNSANLDDTNFKTLMEEVRSHGVNFGLLEDPAPKGNGSWLVAKGEPAVHGENAKVKAYVKSIGAQSSKTKDSKKDTVDFRELDMVVNVPKGKLLLEKILATDGTPGRTVTDETINPKPGKDFNFKIGSGVSLSEDGIKVISEAEGKYMLADGKVSVEVEHIINGDVDISTGNITFIGESLVINGAVLPGFKVKGKKDVYIGQGIQNSAEITVGGNLKIKGGVVGDGVAIKCWGNVNADFIENVGRIEVNGDLLIFDALIQTHTRVSHNLKMLTGKGALVGGTHTVGGSVFVREIGSEAEVVTEVVVGFEPELEAKKKKLEKEKKYWPVKMEEIMKNNIDLQKLKKESGDKFPPEKTALLKKNYEMLPKIMEKVTSLPEKKKALGAEIEQSGNESVYVYGTAFPGTKVTIGDVSRVLINMEEQVVIHLDKSTRRIHCRSMSKKEQKAFN